MSDTPRKLGRYELIRRIAVGGMGEIYLARVSGTGGFEKTVIIKTILPHLAEEDEFVEKFLDEGRIVVNLTHGNIVPVFDMDEVDGEYFIAMDYVPGRDIREILARLRERGESMPPEIAAYIIAEVCEGLGYAHRKTDDEGNPLDIVHRDVSPSNVLISTEGEVKIIDFGIARAADRRAKTVTGRIQGKCCYMSPEQARGNDLDHRSDIFSTGVVFYEMLTGVRPFEGDSDLKSLDLVRACDYEPPSFVEGMVPPQLDAIIDRALAREADERYQTIDEMHVELMEFLAADGPPVTSTDVAAFLEDLFPEGLEREEFQEVVDDEEAESEGAMDLDEAFNKELERLGEDSSAAENIDPLDETQPADAPGPAADIGRGGGRTETLTPETGPKTDDGEGDEAEETAANEIPEGAEVALESDGMADGGGMTEPEGPDEPEPETPATTDEEISDAPPTDEADRPDASAGAGLAGRPVIIGVVLLGLVVGGIGFWSLADDGRGTLSIHTEPPGAAIEVDGETIEGETTPHAVPVNPGTHVLELTKTGYESRQIDVEVEAGRRETLAVHLRQKRDEEADTREFLVRTKPEGAEVIVNQSPVGTAPKKIEVADGETKFVEARKQGCERGQMPVYHGRDSEKVVVRLECEADGDASADAEAEEADEQVSSEGSEPSSDEAAAEPRRPRRIELTFETEPAGAIVRIDGETLGESSVTDRFPARESLSVHVSHEDRQTVEQEITPAEVDGGTVRVRLPEKEIGCLNFFAVHPQYNEIAIDGEWLDGRHQNLQHYELPVGHHQIRVRNPDAGKDETFEFQIEAGDECTSLTVWDPDEG